MTVQEATKNGSNGQVDYAPTTIQELIIQEAVSWFKDETKPQHMSYTGFAGTGKSYIINKIVERLGINEKRIAYVAYTGKAALVMTRKANNRYTATTIHKLIYSYDDFTGEFVLKNKDALKDVYDLIIVDEAGFVDGAIEADLLSFGIKVLATGDLGQLKPIAKKGTPPGTLLANPFANMTEIHRQALDNPLIYLSMLVREGKAIKSGKYGEQVVVMRKNDLTLQARVKLYLRADQIICGYNSTRKQINEQVRRALGFYSQLPVVGDKLICTKNNWQASLDGVNLVNGLTGYVTKIEAKEPAGQLTRNHQILNFRPDFFEDEKKEFQDLAIVDSSFSPTPEKLNKNEYSDYDSFDYGYAITCHKSQGSSWKNLVVFNEVLNRAEHKEWLYTAITRAEERLVLFV